VVDQPVLALVGHHGVLGFQADGAAGRAPDADADPVRRHGSDVESAVRDGLAGADDGELRGPVHPPDLRGGQAERFGVEVDLGGDLGAERAGVEEGDPAGRGAPRGQQVPVGLAAHRAR
jgi:hypothetical protein